MIRKGIIGGCAAGLALLAALPWGAPAAAGDAEAARRAAMERAIAAREASCRPVLRAAADWGGKLALAQRQDGPIETIEAAATLYLAQMLGCEQAAVEAFRCGNRVLTGYLDGDRAKAQEKSLKAEMRKDLDACAGPT